MYTLGVYLYEYGSDKLYDCIIIDIDNKQLFKIEEKFPLILELFLEEKIDKIDEITGVIGLRR